MTTRWIAIAASALLVAGCGKKAGSPSPDPAVQSAETALVVQPAAPKVTPVSVQADAGDTGQMLDQLTKVLRKFCVDNRRVPKTLDEVVAAGYLKQIPPAPAGKKFSIETSKLQVVLVSQ
jgi:hypothetical protein